MSRTFSIRVPACAYKTAHLLDLHKKTLSFLSFLPSDSQFLTPVMKLHIWAALSIALASARSGNAGFVSYTPQTTIAGGGPRPSNTLPVPPAPTNKVPSVPPSSNSYKLNSSFEISATPVTHTYNWIIGYLINSVPFGIYLLRPLSYIARSMALQAGFFNVVFSSRSRADPYLS